MTFWETLFCGALKRKVLEQESTINSLTTQLEGCKVKLQTCLGELDRYRTLCEQSEGNLNTLMEQVTNLTEQATELKATVDYYHTPQGFMALLREVDFRTLPSKELYWLNIDRLLLKALQDFEVHPKDELVSWVVNIVKLYLPTVEIVYGDAPAEKWTTVPYLEFYKILKLDYTNLYPYLGEGVFDCDNFALTLQARMMEYWGVKILKAWGTTPFGSHAFNLFISTEGGLWFLEPQTDATWNTDAMEKKGYRPYKIWVE